MGLFDQFPYTNFHELNLDWILKALKELEHTIDQFVAINALKYADPIQWNITSQYEKNTIVIDPQSGTAYISVQPVPSGVALTNTDYWTVVFDLEQFVTKANNNFTLRVEPNTTLNATFATNTGEWVVWGGVLYEALSNIIAGDQYVVDSNINRITVEEIIDRIKAKLGDLNNLVTTDKSNLVAAINEVANEVLGKIGDLDNLVTTDKSNIVAAINEVVSDINAEAQARATADGDLADLTTTDKSNLVAAINEVANEVLGKIGDLDNLVTTDKSNIVAAINEVVSDINAEAQARATADGDLADLTTTDKSNLVAAINEINSTGGGAIAKIGNLNDLHTTAKNNIVSSINEIFDNIESYIGIDPEKYAGTDVQKIQSAYTEATHYINDHPSHNAVILIRRIYDLTSGTVHFNHPYDDAINGHIIFQGINHGGFYSGAINGFMFDTQITVGTNLWHDFYNLSFFGDPMTLDSRGVFDDNDSSNFSHARVFNMERLSQMRVANCNFTYLGSVYDNRTCLVGDVGCYTIISQNNYYERCADVIDLSYSQNAITFENDYIAMGYRFIASSVDLRALYTLNIINCTVEYLKGFAIQIPSVASKGLAGLNIKNSYFEGISRSIISIQTAFQTMHIDGCTFQVAGMLTAASEGVLVTLDGECQFSFTNNLIMRSTAATGYGLTATASAAALARKFNCMGLRMVDQQNNTIDCINPNIKGCLITDIQQLV